jgi:hypothetical protein
MCPLALGVLLLAPGAAYANAGIPAPLFHQPMLLAVHIAVKTVD